MKAMTITVIVIVVLVLATGLWYTQTHMPRSTPAPTPTPTPTPTATPTPTSTSTPTGPAATVTANLNLKRVDATPGSGHWVLLINGTVANDSPNIAYGVGLHVFSLADGALYPFEEDVDVTVPVASGTYNATSTYALSTIPPNQTVPVNIEIIPPNAAGEWRVLDDATVTVVWSNP
jgi:cytoskeletal protein RodZ